MIESNSFSAGREFYFCSEIPFPSRTTLRPRVPSNRKFEEDSINPRVCVAPSIDDCLSSLDYLEINSKVHCYKVNCSNYKRPSVEEVPDSKHSNEYWCLEPVTLEYMYSIILTERWFEKFDDGDFRMRFNYKILKDK